MENEEGSFQKLEMQPEESQEEYVKRTLWSKIKHTAARVPFLPDVIAMYYTMMDSRTPVWAKATIIAALAYFILPADTIPDIIPLVGFSDDAGAIAAAMAAVRVNMKEEHREKAMAVLKGQDWEQQDDKRST